MHANPTPAHIPEQTPTVEELRLDVAWEARHGIADRIYCRLCAALLVSLYDHIPRHGWTIERYQAEYPSAPLRSVEYRNRQTQSEAARLKADPEAKKKARERTIRWRENQPEAYKAAVARSWAKPETRQKSYANKKKNRELIRAKLAEAERILAQPAQQQPTAAPGKRGPKRDEGKLDGLTRCLDEGLSLRAMRLKIYPETPQTAYDNTRKLFSRNRAEVEKRCKPETVLRLAKLFKKPNVT